MIQSCLYGYGQEARSPRWKVGSVQIATSSPTLISNHTIAVTFVDSGQKNTRVLKSGTFIELTKAIQPVGSKVVILGSGGGFDEALIMDPGAGIVSKRFIGYGIRLLGARWLVSVEWYPNHLFPPQYPSDVVLVQDLHSTAASPPAHKDEWPAKHLSQLVRSAGIPVYPEENALQNAYENVFEDTGLTLSRVYTDTFAIIQGGELVFVASFGTEQEQQSQRLVIVKLGQGVVPGGSIRYQSLQSIGEELHLQAGAPLQISAIDEVTAVRL